MRKRELQPDQIKRIVVRAPNWVGDVVMSVPALRQLRRLFPDAHITLVTRPGSSDILLDADFVDEVLIQDGLGLRSVAQQIREWRQRSFDVAVLCQNAFHS